MRVGGVVLPSLRRMTSNSSSGAAPAASPALAPAAEKNARHSPRTSIRFVFIALISGHNSDFSLPHMPRQLFVCLVCLGGVGFLRIVFFRLFLIARLRRLFFLLV